MYSLSFKKRLVEDFRLPIKILDEPYFSYLLDLYRTELEIDDKISILTNSLEMTGGETQLKSEWYRIKDLIKADIKSLPRYDDFLKYVPNYELKATLQNGHPYNHGMLDKTCVSIDIKTANYNALRHFDKSLVFNTDTFSEFIKKYTHIPLFESSKIFRQLLFEPLNAKKQGQIQKSIINQTADEINHRVNPLFMRNVSNDELILVFNKTDDLQSLENKVTSALVECTFNDLLKTEAFNVIHLHEDLFYKKTQDNFSLRNVSSQLYPQMFKKVKGLDINELDLAFFDTNSKLIAKYLNPIFKD